MANANLKHNIADQEQLDNANALWARFATSGKYVIMATCVFLILLALAFFDFT